MLSSTIRRSLKRISQPSKPQKRTVQRGSRRLGFEPLEERALLNATPGWAFDIEGSNGVTRSAVNVDAESNVFVGSSFSGTVDFDPGSGVFNLTASGGPNGDGFIAKYTQAQELVRARSFGGSSNDERVVKIDLDASGNVYVAGFFASSTAQFGGITLTNERDTANTPNWDAYVAKLDSQGNFLWAHNFGGVENDRGWDISVSPSGEVLAAGAFRDQVDFDPDPNSDVTLTSAGERDAVVWKLDADGNFQWVRSFGGLGNDDAYRVVTDEAGDIFVTGPFMQTVNFGTTEDPMELTSASADLPDTFVLKMDAAGATTWVRQVTGPGTVGASRLVLGSSGSLFTGGWFDGSAEFDGGTTILSSSSEKDAYVAKWDTDGTFLWAEQLTATGDIKPQRLVVDNADNVYMTGRFKGTADFDPDSESEFTLGAADAAWDGFLLQLDGTGEFANAYHYTGPATVRTDGIALDASGNIYTSGSFNTSATLPPGDVLVASGMNDTFVNKLLTAPGVTPLFSDSFEVGTWNGLWVEDSQNDWFRSTQRAIDGNYSAEVDGRATDATLTLANAVDLTPYGSAELTFSWYIESRFDSGEYLALDLFDGTTWNEVARLRGNVDQENVWHQETIEIDGSYLVDDFNLRFRAKASRSNEDGNVDDVQLIATSLAGPPNQLPLAEAGGPYAVDEGSNVTLDASASSDSDGTIVSYEWDLDSDGQYDDATGVTASFSSNQHGAHTVGLRVTDDLGGTGTDTATVNVANVAPTAEAGGPYAGDEGSNIVLDGSASSGPADDIVNYDWDLDNDGQYDDASGVSVAFNSTDDGVFTVGLRVTDDFGATSTDTASVTVSNVAPTADAGGPYSTDEGVDVTVTAAGSSDPGNDIDSYAWDLDNDGDYDDATGVTATFNSATAGVFNIAVKVTDDDGQFSTDSTTVTVSEPSTNTTKFFVVDTSLDDMFEYQADGTYATNYNLGSGNNAPRGAAATAAGDTVWVIDNDDHVYVHDADGNLLRSWKALGLSRPEGIATDGTDVWIVDRGNDRVHYFAGGATRTTDTGATFSFSLAAGNPRGITTDGTHLWVVDTGKDQVYKYTVAGALLGNWDLDSRNTVPRGITINPANVGDIWVIDSTDDAIYQYTAAAGRTSGSQSASSVFNLAVSNTNPQGIADPPPAISTAPSADLIGQDTSDGYLFSLLASVGTDPLRVDPPSIVRMKSAALSPNDAASRTRPSAQPTSLPTPIHRDEAFAQYGRDALSRDDVGLDDETIDSVLSDARLLENLVSLNSGEL